MIELRWLERSHPPGIATETGGKRFYVVLQMREGMYGEDQAPWDGSNLIWCGTEWRDVPYVSDAAGDKESQ